MSLPTVIADDGTTAIKLGHLDPKDPSKITESVTAHSFKEGHSIGSYNGEGSPNNFIIEGRHYQFEYAGSETLDSTNTEYQTSDQNVLAIHYALHESSLQPGEIKLVVTLPLKNFYLKDGSRNRKAIEEKIKNVKRVVTALDGKKEVPGFVIKEVEVMPEGIPALATLIAELKVSKTHRTLLVDVGGTTLDMAIIEGNLWKITPKGINHIGVRSVLDTIIEEIGDDYEMNPLLASMFLKSRKDDQAISRYVTDERKSAVLKEVENSIDRLAESVVRECKIVAKTPDTIALVGGGASLVKNKMEERYPRSQVEIVNNPQTAVARELAEDFAPVMNEEALEA